MGEAGCGYGLSTPNQILKAEFDATHANFNKFVPD
jgi:hypothetical protein